MFQLVENSLMKGGQSADSGMVMNEKLVPPTRIERATRGLGMETGRFC